MLNKTWNIYFRKVQMESDGKEEDSLAELIPQVPTLEKNKIKP